jgi:serine-type D-Ala-D-Ala carboxypeptidase/endopeptidase (penicillin-binding protein 4)
MNERHRGGGSGKAVKKAPSKGVHRAIFVAVALVALAAIGGTVVLSAPKLLSKIGAAPAPAAPPAPTLVLRALAAGAPTPTAAALESTLSKPLAAIPGTVSGTVIDPANGSVLWEHQSDKALGPGSTAKLVTAAAALLTLNPTDALVTRVVAGPTPGSVILVGGGDPTLTALPDGKEGTYPDPSRLVDLAKKVKAANPGPIDSVLIDTSRYTGDTMAPGWDPADIKAGNITPIVPLMLDGGRVDPTAQDGERTDKPALAAGKALAELLGVDTSTVAEAKAGPDARQLAAVASAPIAELVENALRASDNVLAEALAREVAISSGGEASFAGAAKAVVAALNQAGIDASGVSMVDGSGLSTDDKITAKVLGSILNVAATPAKNPSDVQFLRPILTGLPVAGGDGTLEDRFAADGAAATGRGVVRAKTGTLSDVSSLAGVVTDSDGRLLVFAVMSNGALPSKVRPKLDGFAATLSSCGCR